MINGTFKVFAKFVYIFPLIGYKVILLPSNKWMLASSYILYYAAKVT